MKKIIVLGLIAIPFHAFAAPSISEFEKRVVSASKWSEVGDQLKEVLPGNVVNDFIKSTEGIPYPTAKKPKKGVEFFQSNGLRVLLQFKKDGVVSINNQDWIFEPLASVDSEVKRLEVFLSGEHKRVSSFSYFGLIQVADAGVAGGAAGIAHTAYARGTEHKAIACGGENLSESLKNDCPLMAVGMQPMVQLASTSAGADKKKMYPIQLTCPPTGDGVLELISKNKEGTVERYRLQIKESKSIYIRISYAKNGGVFEDAIAADLTIESDSIDYIAGMEQKNQGELINQKICKAPNPIKEKYLAKLEKNKSALTSQASLPKSTNSNGSTEAL